ncbi:MAG TPA: SMI1/KNR4 family protein [Polyangiaceae bacterium]|nr:SMI1/KNR4 family protein [Polyangiaceae bacterium]
METESLETSRSTSSTAPPALAWEATLQRIYWLHTALSELAPERNDGLVPNPPATEESLAAAERRIGRALPPSYREFLLRHDGWPRFLYGATLLGTVGLGRSSYGDLARAAFEAEETPVPEGGPPSTVRGYPGELIPFGIDPSGTSVFAFDPKNCDSAGEMAVVAWINEIGMRADSFAGFLEMVAELSDADVSICRARAAQ